MTKSDLNAARIPESIPEPLRDLYRAAAGARAHAYSPYSNHKVGAAFRTSDGEVYAGCNVENSSYGATICAERNAIFSAVGRLGKIVIREILVITDASPPWPPCGLCRQVIAEFAQPQIPVHTANLHGELRTVSFGELFPQAFTPQHLNK